MTQRLTETVRQQLLELNEGFERTTHYDGKNFRETRHYTIQDGSLHIRETGKTSWADSRFDNSYVADPEQTHRFLANHRDVLDWNGVDPTRLIERAEPEPDPVEEDEPIDDVNPNTGAPEYLYDFADEKQEHERSADRASREVAGALVLFGLVVGGVVVVAVKYGRPVWNEKVKPAVGRLRDAIRRRNPDEPGDNES